MKKIKIKIIKDITGLTHFDIIYKGCEIKKIKIKKKEYEK